MSKRKAQ